MGVNVTDLAGRARVTLGEMEQITRSANIPTLLMVIYQVTGDPRWLQPPYRPTRSRGLSDHDTGGPPEGIQHEIQLAPPPGFLPPHQAHPPPNAMPPVLLPPRPERLGPALRDAARARGLLRPHPWPHRGPPAHPVRHRGRAGRVRRAARNLAR